MPYNQHLKARIKRITEKFDIFHQRPKSYKGLFKCYRLELGALLGKAAILMAKDVK